MISIFDKTRHNDMGYALNVLSAKDKQIANNVSNVDTPMYKATKLVFEEAMSEYFSSSSPANKLYATDSKHLQAAGSVESPASFVRHQNNPSTRTDGNDVNIEYEMTEQAGSTILSTFIMSVAGSKFGTLKDIIKS